MVYARSCMPVSVHIQDADMLKCAEQAYHPGSEVSVYDMLLCACRCTDKVRTHSYNVRLTTSGIVERDSTALCTGCRHSSAYQMLEHPSMAWSPSLAMQLLGIKLVI